ncbi:hypothetical protein ACH5RR_010770 [Cinchona calisaya]|uniref:Uncharacterized protein n=1 Tax=Cinchona calisaya TaxID=153742 RepID=A0ABD3AJV0_9GENT
MCISVYAGIINDLTSEMLQYMQFTVPFSSEHCIYLCNLEKFQLLTLYLNFILAARNPRYCWQVEKPNESYTFISSVFRPEYMFFVNWMGVIKIVAFFCALGYISSTALQCNDHQLRDLLIRIGQRSKLH